MQITRLWILCLFTACSSPQEVLVRRPPPRAPIVNGRLMVVGGGGTTPAMVARMLELAGGKDARIVILPQASSQPDRGKGSLELFAEAGATNSICLDPLEETAGGAELESAALIWFPGGDQVQLMAALDEARLVDDVQRRFRQGAIVGGTSAGAAVMSPLMMTGEADLESVRGGTTELVSGLGLWDEVIVDQHFVRRQRWARLVSAVLDHSEFVGVGIDERTAVEVAGDVWRVWGDGSVVVLDARRAEAAAGLPGEHSTARDVQFSILKDGETFSLR
ncbi:MAG: cyanophycinase [Planctomycetes bacterium]|nr:cyanophycinase [Planctomycetota bacterium]